MTVSMTINRKMGVLRFLVAVAVCALALVRPTAAWADEVVTYEVVSDDISTVSVEYQVAAGRHLTADVPLPWRFEAPVRSVGGAPPEGSQVRADWHTRAAPGKWVTVRIMYQGKVVCQSTLDVGNATCYGITRRIT